MTDLHTDQLAQATLAEFLKRGLFHEASSRMRKIYTDRLNALDEALRKFMPEGVRWTSSRRRHVLSGWSSRRASMPAN